MLTIAVAATLLRVAIYVALAWPFGDMATAICHHDCEFYGRIAQQGYGSDAHYHDRGFYPNLAYFPALPLLMRAGTALTGAGKVAVGMAVAALALAAIAGLGGAYVERSRPDGTMRLWLLSLLVAPYGFYFSIPYTEGLFAAAAMGVLLARQLRLPLLAALFAAAGSATRPTGVILSLLVVADQAAAFWRRRGERPRMLVLAEVLPPVALCGLGLSAFMAWQAWTLGDPFAFSRVQAIWDRRWLGPLTWLRLGWRVQDWGNLLGPFRIQSFTFNAAAGMLGLAAGLWLAARRRFAEAWLCLAAILLPLGSGLHSMPRFVGANPAFLLACYDALASLRRGAPALFRIAIIAMTGAQILLLAAWYSRAGGLF